MPIELSGDSDEDRDLQRLTLALVETCVRNTQIEHLHAGRTPRTVTGDYSDVTVLTPDGAIPWTEVSRITDEEMKSLMIEVTDRLYTCLGIPEVLDGLRTSTSRWDRPKLDANLMKRVERIRAGRAVGDAGLDDGPT